MKLLILFVVATSLLTFHPADAKEVPMQDQATGAFKRTMDTTYITTEGCRVERFRIYSPSMERDIRAVVVLPPAYLADQARQFPILYTLHGHAAPYDTWAEMSLLRAQLKDKPFIYTCFDGDNSSQYIDARFPQVTARESEADTTTRKSLFFTFFFNEFMPAIDGWYRVDGAKRGVTGFSMGGGGALTYGLNRPELFTSVSVLSSGMSSLDTLNEKRMQSLAAKLGPFAENRTAYQVLDHARLIAELKKKGAAIPALYASCGTEDAGIARARAMKATLDSLGIPVEYVETAGAHNWKFWHPASVGVAKFHWKYFSK
jgi:S-formylglutathione hydrolase FrmB